MVLVEQSSKARDSATIHTGNLEQSEHGVSEAQGLVGTAYRAYEDMTLHKMRQVTSSAICSLFVSLGPSIIVFLNVSCM